MSGWRRATCADNESAEVKKVWRRAKCANTECAEVLRDENEGVVLLRSSQKPYKFAELTVGEWNVFVVGVKNGDFDDL